MSSNQKEFLFTLALIFISILIAFGLSLTNGLEPETIPEWRGIIPGQTTKREVVSILGPPDNIVVCMKWGKDLENPYDPEHGYLYRRCSFGPLTYEYEEKRAPSKAPGTHQIHFRGNTVWLVVEDMSAYSFEDRLPIDDVIFEFGLPEEEAWNRRYRRRLLYCEQGKIVGVNDIVVEDTFYIEPMTTDECLYEFRFYLTLTDPGVIME